MSYQSILFSHERACFILPMTDRLTGNMSISTGAPFFNIIRSRLFDRWNDIPSKKVSGWTLRVRSSKSKYE